MGEQVAEGEILNDMVMEPGQSLYLNRKHTVVDITAVDETTFYLLILFGEDRESANFLVKYTVS